MAAPPTVSFGTASFDVGRWPVPSLEFSPNSIRRSPFGTGAPHRQMGGCSAVTAWFTVRPNLTGLNDH
jgi:hypothetical protein